MASRDQDGDGEQADAGVDPGGQRGQGTGERHVGQRVGGEHLCPQHQEVADQAGGERHPGPGEEGILHERMRQHRRPAEGDGGHATAALARRRPARSRPRANTAVLARAPRYRANPMVVSQKPTGYGE